MVSVCGTCRMPASSTEAFDTEEAAEDLLLELPADSAGAFLLDVLLDEAAAAVAVPAAAAPEDAGEDDDVIMTGPGASAGGEAEVVSAAAAAVDSTPASRFRELFRFCFSSRKMVDSRVRSVSIDRSCRR